MSLNTSNTTDRRSSNSISSSTTTAITTPKECQATYLVIGAGTAGMSFIDALLTLDASATVILVDRNTQPGGHWTHSYPFVQLHQTGCNYGVNSLPLAHDSNVTYNNNKKKKNGSGFIKKEKFDKNDRATGMEIVEYYKKVAKQFEECGRVQMFFNCEYSSSSTEEDGDDDKKESHVITNITTREVTKVTCTKIVKVYNNVIVPSMRDGPPFPVHSNINFVPVNDLPITNIIQSSSKQYTNYIVIGCGKTGCDAITYLLRNKKIDPNNITWIISRDVWYLLRDGVWPSNGTMGYKNFRKEFANLIEPLVMENVTTAQEIFLQYEKMGIAGRLDPHTRPIPKVFKGPMIDTSELKGFRTIKNVVHLGRVTEITNDTIILNEGTIPVSTPSDTLIVDCMADFDGSFYGYRDWPEDKQVFEGDKINLGPLFVAFNPSCSAALTAYIESTFEDDCEMKNKLLYFLHQRKDTEAKPDMWPGLLYAQLKTFKALGCYPPAVTYAITSRTFLDAPCHHYKGMMGLLWASFGPQQMAKKGDEFIKKVEESGCFTDDCFGYKDRPMVTKREVKLKKKLKVKSNYPPPPPHMKSKSSKVRYNCCATVEVVE